MWIYSTSDIFTLLCHVLCLMLSGGTFQRLFMITYLDEEILVSFHLHELFKAVTNLSWSCSLLTISGDGVTCLFWIFWKILYFTLSLYTKCSCRIASKVDFRYASCWMIPGHLYRVTFQLFLFIIWKIHLTSRPIAMWEIEKGSLVDFFAEI